VPWKFHPAIPSPKMQVLKAMLQKEDQEWYAWALGAHPHAPFLFGNLFCIHKQNWTKSIMWPKTSQICNFWRLSQIFLFIFPPLKQYYPALDFLYYNSNVRFTHLSIVLLILYPIKTLWFSYPTAPTLPPHKIPLSLKYYNNQVPSIL
jgi:hypothetical protein